MMIQKSAFLLATNWQSSLNTASSGHRLADASGRNALSRVRVRHGRHFPPRSVLTVFVLSFLCSCGLDQPCCCPLATIRPHCLLSSLHVLIKGQPGAQKPSLLDCPFSFLSVLQPRVSLRPRECITATCV